LRKAKKGMSEMDPEEMLTEIVWRLKRAIGEDQNLQSTNVEENLRTVALLHVQGKISAATAWKAIVYSWDHSSDNPNIKAVILEKTGQKIDVNINDVR
jgi:uncharacterized protein YndB with AHSA1/START domain